MQLDFVNTVNDFGKSAFDSMRALGEINGKLAEKMLAQQLDVANLCVEGGMAQVKVAQDSKDVKDYLTRQSSLVEEYAGKFLALAKSQASLVREAGSEYQAWLDVGLKQANGAVKTTAKKAAA